MRYSQCQEGLPPVCMDFPKKCTAIDTNHPVERSKVASQSKRTEKNYHTHNHPPTQPINTMVFDRLRNQWSYRRGAPSNGFNPLASLAGSISLKSNLLASEASSSSSCFEWNKTKLDPPSIQFIPTLRSPPPPAPPARVVAQQSPKKKLAKGRSRRTPSGRPKTIAPSTTQLQLGEALTLPKGRTNTVPPRPALRRGASSRSHLKKHGSSRSLMTTHTASAKSLE